MKAVFQGLRWDEQSARKKDHTSTTVPAGELVPPTRASPDPALLRTRHLGRHAALRHPVLPALQEGLPVAGREDDQPQMSDIPAWEQDLEHTEERAGAPAGQGRPWRGCASWGTCKGCMERKNVTMDDVARRARVSRRPSRACCTATTTSPRRPGGTSPGSSRPWGTSPTRSPAASPTSGPTSSPWCSRSSPVTTARGFSSARRRRRGSWVTACSSAVPRRKAWASRRSPRSTRRSTKGCSSSTAAPAGTATRSSAASAPTFPS